MIQDGENPIGPMASMPFSEWACHPGASLAAEADDGFMVSDLHRIQPNTRLRRENRAARERTSLGLSISYDRSGSK
jgi:hypothetical protein